MSSSLEGIDRRDVEGIERLISSDESPVGIDAKRTHVLILQQLLEIQSRLDRLERRLSDEADRR